MHVYDVLYTSLLHMLFLQCLLLHGQNWPGCIDHTDKTVGHTITIFITVFLIIVIIVYIHFSITKSTFY